MKTLYFDWVYRKNDSNSLKIYFFENGVKENRVRSISLRWLAFRGACGEPHRLRLLGLTCPPFPQESSHLRFISLIFSKGDHIAFVKYGK
jgi:hypothetical protein